MVLDQVEGRRLDVAVWMLPVPVPDIAPSGAIPARRRHDGINAQRLHDEICEGRQIGCQTSTPLSNQIRHCHPRAKSTIDHLLQQISPTGVGKCPILGILDITL